MGNLKMGWLVTGALAVTVVAVAMLLYARFRRDIRTCLLYTSPSPRDLSTSRMPSSA